MHQVSIKWPPLFWFVHPPGIDQVLYSATRPLPRTRGRDNDDAMEACKFAWHFAGLIFLHPRLRNVNRCFGAVVRYGAHTRETVLIKVPWCAVFNCGTIGNC